MADDAKMYVVREMALLNNSLKDTTKMIDIGNAKEVTAVIEVQSTTGTPSLVCNGYTSIDGERWFAISDLNFATVTTPKEEKKSSTTGLLRYVRWNYELTGGTPTATWGIKLFVKPN